RLFAVLGLLGLAACVPQAQPRSAEPVTREVTGLAGADARVFAPRPAFKVEAVSFEALDETGPDFPADDDVYAVFIDGSPREQFTETFKSVDVGEVQYFRPGPRCISPVHQCAERGRVDGLSFGISLWEEDQLPFWEFNPGCFPYDFCRWESGINPKDDLIGRKELAFSEAELIAAMPNVGDTVEHVIDLMGFSCDPPPGGACAGPFSGPHYL